MLDCLARKRRYACFYRKELLVLGSISCSRLLEYLDGRSDQLKVLSILFCGYARFGVLFFGCSCHGNRGLTHPYKTGLYGEECLLVINSSQESYLSDVGLNPTRVLAANSSGVRQGYACSLLHVYSGITT
ncbi:hypothetical protein MTR_3g047410 [Medicago truncatula]|uniref:Uncharacterized protein n=1 Tax=Medicago truncatula TaxID=3880 RepID=G7IXI6_MEDTR|nr:hypothetical protein MTR_3g047410 [Medicago truncatula]